MSASVELGVGTVHVLSDGGRTLLVVVVAGNPISQRVVPCVTLANLNPCYLPDVDAFAVGSLDLHSVGDRRARRRIA